MLARMAKGNPGHDLMLTAPMPGKEGCSTTRYRPSAMELLSSFFDMIAFTYAVCIKNSFNNTLLPVLSGFTQLKEDGQYEFSSVR